MLGPRISTTLHKISEMNASKQMVRWDRWGRIQCQRQDSHGWTNHSSELLAHGLILKSRKSGQRPMAKCDEMVIDSLRLHLFPEWSSMWFCTGLEKTQDFLEFWREMLLNTSHSRSTKNRDKLTWLMATLHIDDHSKNTAHLLLMKSSYNTLKKLSP